MWKLNYFSVNEIKNILTENTLAMSKQFGQNFLISKPVLDKLVSHMDLSEGMKVWEIGPGLGVLTSELIKAKTKLTCFEIDHGFVDVLLDKAFPDDDLRVIPGDFIKNFVDFYKSEGTPDLICGNLPYNVGALAIASLIQHRCLPDRMVFTLQSEVVGRITASVLDPSYSSFSLVCALDYETNSAFKIKPSSFWPEPKVDSSVVVFKKRLTPIIDEDKAPLYFLFLRELFSNRRKMIKNNLENMYLGSDAEMVSKLLEKCGLTGHERPQDLTVYNVVDMVNNYGS